MAAPDDNAVLTRRIDPIAAQDLHNPRRRAGQIGVVSEDDPPDIERMKGVHILFRADEIGHQRLVDVRRQR